MTHDASNKFAEAFKVNLKNGKISLKGSLNASNTSNLYQFNVANRSRFNFDLNKVDGNVELTLFNRTGKIVAVSNEHDGKPEFIRRVLNTGKYFVRVQRISGEINYRLKSKVIELAGTRFSSALKITPPANANARLDGKFTYNGSLNAKNKSAFYQFQLSDRSTFLGLLEGLDSDADIELYDGNHQRIVFSTTNGTDSELIDQVLEAGTYFIKIKAKGDRIKTKYKLKFAFNSLVDDDGFDQTRLITLGSSNSVSKNFTGLANLDNLYKVDLTSPSSLNLVLDGLSADANLQLFNRDGTLLASSTNAGTAQDVISRSLKAGRYFVRVTPGAAGIATNYTLNADVGALKLFGLTDQNSLVAFNPDKPDDAVTLDVTGLASGETLQSIDFRPATGELYGLSSSKLYTIDIATGIARPVGGTLSPELAGAIGLDFNPAADRLRAVNDADTNLRLSPTGAIAATDTKLAYAAGDTNAGVNPNVTAIAYSNNRSGASTTTLFGIDTVRDVLVRQGSPNGTPTSPNTGTLFTVGALGVNFESGTGFDIFTDNSLTNTAYAISGSTLYGINLTTGKATSLGDVSFAPASNTSSTSAPATVNLIGLTSRIS